MATLTFGKHEGLSISAVLQIDPSYCEWFVAQPGVDLKHPIIVKEMRAGLTKHDITPDHNRVQAMFADVDFAKAYFVKAFGKDPSEVDMGKLEVKVEFEKAGFDVLITGGISTKRRLGIEVKPSIGDDYPAVLRQINKAGMHHTGGNLVDKRAVAYDVFNDSAVPFETICAMFNASSVALISVNDLDLVTF